jgi:hypothetical protein
MTEKIVFIAESLYFRDMSAKVCNHFITHIQKECKDFDITIFWTDQSLEFVKASITAISPSLIIFFDINSFSHTTKNFDFVFEYNIPVYLLIDDSYYIHRNMIPCECVQKTHGIILWYKNEKALRSLKYTFPQKQILNLSSRFVNTNVFYDRQLPKKYDILLYGSRHYEYTYKKEKNNQAIQEYIQNYESFYSCEIDNEQGIEFYPLRNRMMMFLEKYKNKYNIKIVPEACYDSPIANEDLSTLINQSHLTIACCSIADVLLHKYLEISASGSIILGNIPSDYRNMFENRVVEIDEFMGDEEINFKIDYALANKRLLSSMSSNLKTEISRKHTLECAVNNFSSVVNDIFEHQA